MIPLATTTITVQRSTADETTDPYEEVTYETVASGVRARIGQQSARERVAGGTQGVLDLRVWCDPIEGGLQATDRVVDEATGDVYELDGPGFLQRGLGLDHLVAPIKQVEGVA